MCLLGMCIFLALKLGKARLKIDEQELVILKFKTVYTSAQIDNYLLSGKIKNNPKLSPTAEKLLTLSAKSNNKGEAEAAAVQACKRIYKELGYK